MVEIQPIRHDGDVVAFVVGGYALISDHLVDDAVDLVRAKCLYALEVEAGRRPTPYSDHAATRYALHVVSRDDRRCRTPRVA
jgi:hypothetical protein